MVMVGVLLKTASPEPAFSYPQGEFIGALRLDKDVGLLRKLRHRGLERVGWMFTMAAATYNLVRMRTLMPKCG